ncbi:MAG: site-specific integrase [Roseomonas mucosa]|nr:site-specific integrase [Roseomonas mucosa]
MDLATARGWREGPNPAAWRGNLAHELPPKTKVRAVRHHPALPWQQMAGFMTALRKQPGTAAIALELLILTAARTNEVLQARWSEFDLDVALWLLPAGRTKAHREHRVPLSKRAVELLTPLKAAATADGWVFPGGKDGRPLSGMALLMLLRRMNAGADGKPLSPPRWRDAKGAAIVAHGFRSSFRDWCSEAAAVPRDVAEAALAHAERDATVAAYARSDHLEQRKLLMERWAGHCEPAPAENVLAFAKPAS